MSQNPQNPTPAARLATLATLTLGLLAVAVVCLPPRARKDGPDFAAFGRIPVMSGGRLMPLDSVARTSLRECNGKVSVTLEAELPGGLSHGKTMGPEAWLAEVFFDLASARDRQALLVENEEVKALFGKQEEKGKRFTLGQVVAGGEKIEQLAMKIASKPREHRDTFERQLMATYGRLTTITRLAQGAQPAWWTDTKAMLDTVPALVERTVPETRKMQAGQPYDEESVRQLSAFLQGYQTVQSLQATDGLQVVPPGKDAAGTAAWRDIGTVVLEETARGNPNEAVDAWARIGDAFRQIPADRGAAFNAEVGRYLDWLDQSGTPGLAKPKVEWWFNHTEIFFWLPFLYALAFALVVASWLTGWEGFRRAAFALLLVTLAAHTVGLGIRIYLTGRPPVTNLYSSAIFIGWFVLILCLVVEKWVLKNGIGSSVAAVIGFATMIIAHFFSLDGDTMEVKQAVLNSNFWLTIHVLTVSIGYCATLMAGIMALVWLPLRLARASFLDARAQRVVAGCVYGVVCFAMLFSFVGTVTGGIWGDQSWGRFWGWDPKENGALIIVLWNALILHARWGGLVRERGLMALALAGIIVTAWSWVGTNMLGIGLHSYGFMEKGFWAMGAVDAAVLVFIGLVALVPKEEARPVEKAG